MFLFSPMFILNFLMFYNYDIDQTKNIMIGQLLSLSVLCTFLLIILSIYIMVALGYIILCVLTLFIWQIDYSNNNTNGKTYKPNFLFWQQFSNYYNFSFFGTDAEMNNYCPNNNINYTPVAQAIIPSAPPMVEITIPTAIMINTKDSKV